MKTYGYGTPVRIDYQVEGEQASTAVFHTSCSNHFGHEHMSDRAQTLLWAHECFNRLPRHARAIDVGVFQTDGNLVSVGKADEFSLLTEYIEGTGYNHDLQRLIDTNSLLDLDIDRTDALCDYLVDIHSVRGTDPGLYTRRIRELIGHGECIMGLIDSYPPDCAVPPALLEEIEQLCVKWRWKLKPLQHRLRQVHGDFHPWNILFKDGSDFRVLDRSRGEFGDSADDVACITSNFLFFALQRHGNLQGPLRTLFERFWERYLARSRDFEILRVVPPFFAFRGLVMASPVWYPGLSDKDRRALLAFICAVLRVDQFDPLEVNNYCSTDFSSLRNMGHRAPLIG